MEEARPGLHQFARANALTPGVPTANLDSEQKANISWLPFPSYRHLDPN